MSARKPEELLGGYATGTLTDEERRLLFEAALHDQALFEALADDQALKELLEDPMVRRRLVEALQQRLRHRPAGRGWILPEWASRPVILKLTGTVAAALLLVVVVVGVYREGGLPLPGDRAEQETVDAASEADMRSRDDERTESARASRRKEDAVTSRAPETAQSRAAEGPASRAERSPAGVGQPEESAAPGGSAFEATARPGSSPGRGAPAAEAPRSQTWRVTASFAGEAARGQAPAKKAMEKPRALREPAGFDAPSTQAERVEEGVADPSGARLGLRYRIVERAPQGPDRTVRMGGTLDARRTLDLVVEIEQRGYLYVVAETEAGRRIVLFPEPAADESAAATRREAEVRAGEAARLSLDAVLRSAREQALIRVLLLLARQPLEAPGTGVAAEVVDAVQRAGDASTLRIEPQGPRTDATVVANPSDAPDALIAVTLAFDPVA